MSKTISFFIVFGRSCSPDGLLHRQTHVVWGASMFPERIRRMNVCIILTDALATCTDRSFDSSATGQMTCSNYEENGTHRFYGCWESYIFSLIYTHTHTCTINTSTVVCIVILPPSSLQFNYGTGEGSFSRHFLPPLISVILYLKRIVCDLKQIVSVIRRGQKRDT